jgi:DNA-directed RNA polymerase subunit M/transcription elongation factor TFIIS
LSKESVPTGIKMDNYYFIGNGLYIHKECNSIIKPRLQNEDGVILVCDVCKTEVSLNELEVLELKKEHYNQMELFKKYFRKIPEEIFQKFGVVFQRCHSCKSVIDVRSYTVGETYPCPMCKSGITRYNNPAEYNF